MTGTPEQARPARPKSGLDFTNTVFPHIVSSFLNLEMQRSQYIRPKVTVHRGAETIQGRKLFKGGNYMRKYGTYYEDKPHMNSNSVPNNHTYLFDINLSIISQVQCMYVT